MPSLRFKGNTFVENHHLAVPFHELRPVRSKGLSPKGSLHEKLMQLAMTLDNARALPHRNECRRHEVL